MEMFLQTKLKYLFFIYFQPFEVAFSLLLFWRKFTSKETVYNLGNMQFCGIIGRTDSSWAFSPIRSENQLFEKWYKLSFLHHSISWKLNFFQNFTYRHF
jgi:hypothetical protein